MLFEEERGRILIWLYSNEKWPCFLFYVLLEIRAWAPVRVMRLEMQKPIIKEKKGHLIALTRQSSSLKQMYILYVRSDSPFCGLSWKVSILRIWRHTSLGLIQVIWLLKWALGHWPKVSLSKIILSKGQFTKFNSLGDRICLHNSI